MYLYTPILTGDHGKVSTSDSWLGGKAGDSHNAVPLSTYSVTLISWPLTSPRPFPQERENEGRPFQTVGFCTDP